MDNSHATAILVPTRGRPNNVVRLIKALEETAQGKFTVFLYIDHDEEYFHEYSQIDGPVMSVIGSRIKLARAWERLADVAIDLGYGYLAFWADDVVPETTGWDKRFIDVLSEHNNVGFAYGPDGIWDSTFDTEIPGQLTMPTHAVTTPKTWEAFGGFPAESKHLALDMCWRDLCVAVKAQTGTDVMYYLPDVKITHFHRFNHKAPNDKTYIEANDTQQNADDHQAQRAWATDGRMHEAVQRVANLL